MGIDELPDALVQHILLQLRGQDLVSIGCANGEWMRLSRNSAEALLSERYGQSDAMCSMRQLLVAEAIDDAIGPWPGPGTRPPTSDIPMLWHSEWEPMKRAQLRHAGVSSEIIDDQQNVEADGQYGITETLFEYAAMQEAMICSGYSRMDAQTLVLLEFYFGDVLERAWRSKDKCFPISTHVLLDTLQRRAIRDVGVAAPEVYTAISRLSRQGTPEEWAFLTDATEDNVGAQWLSQSIVVAQKPDLENFPNGAGFCWTELCSDGVWRRVREDSDIVCILGDEGSGAGYRSPIHLFDTHYIVPPFALVTLEEVHAPGTWTVERAFTSHCGIPQGPSRVHVMRRLLVVSVLYG